MNDFYVYAHYRATDGQVFYIGKGRKRRAWDKTRRNKFWHSVVSKHGIRIEILCDGLSNEEACNKEQEYIAQHGRRDLGDGPLVNLTDGGDTPINVVHTPERKRRLSEKFKKYWGDEEFRAKVLASRAKLFENYEYRERKRKIISEINKRPEQRELKRQQMLGNKHSLGRVMPWWERERRSESNKGKKRSKKTRERLAAAKQGNRNPNYNPAVYRFVHEDGRVFEGTQNEFRYACLDKKFHRRVSELANGLRRQVDGWFLNEVRPRLTTKGVATVKGESHGCYDDKKRTYYHPDHGIFIGTQFEFAKAFGLHSPSVSRITTGARKVHKGWRLA